MHACFYSAYIHKIRLFTAGPSKGKMCSRTSFCFCFLTNHQLKLITVDVEIGASDKKREKQRR